MIWLDTWEQILELKSWESSDVKRYFLFKNCPLSKLIKSLDDSRTHKKRIIARALYPLFFEKNKTEKIIDAVKNGIPLPPPILFVDEGDLIIEDGNHRINYAYFLSEKSIPILVWNNGEQFNHDFIVHLFHESTKSNIS